ncbi:MAG: PTS sugar transporter subunit IIC [candidate division Zixibacteria bacterium]|nr:PTS sugar transporter subunit IIC [candidate division Zixibacteria bacterium]
MLVETILILILAGLYSLDKTEVAQTMLSQPLVSGTLVGLILGDLFTGIKIGVVFQLIWFWVVPIGSALFPDTAVGGVIASAVAIWLKRSLLSGGSDFAFFLLILYIIVFSLFSGWSIILQRKLNFGFIQEAEVFSEKIGFRKIAQLVWLAVFLSFVRGVVFAGLGILGFYFIFLPLIKSLSFLPIEYFSLTKTVVLGFGCACIFDFFGRKANWVWIGLGGAIGIFIFLIL